MLLPSDVARLVLGYLQQEKLTSTCQSFIVESPNLKEYVEHHTDDGTIPGCLLSLFGKNLTAILNEYITMKAKENQPEVQFMMSSLWKKLDLTLSQIRSMQESAAFNNHQNVRTRKGISDRLRQRMLTSPLAVSGSSTSHPVMHQTSTPIMATQYVLRPQHTPGALQPIASSSFGGESTVQSGNSTSISNVEPAQSSSVVCTVRKPTAAATASPMRRKQDIQRRRRVAPFNSSTVASDGDTVEDVDSLEAIIDNDFPQLVIENAREKILSNKSLQEKLAESINKFLGSDSAAQSSKQTDGTTAEQDSSIDEILGLQGGEMHMSEEAIHDILTQTELDPEFQELYDLFACVTSKAPKMTSRDSSTGGNDPKNIGTGKGRKQDVVERLLEVESAGSTECAKKIDESSKGKDVTNSSGRYNEKSLVDQPSQLPSTSQQSCANESSNLENQTASCDNLNTTLIARSCTDETLMDTDLPGAEVEVTSQIDETKNLSPSKEGAAYGLHIAEDMLLPNTSIADKSVSTETVNVEPKDIPTTKVTISTTPSVEAWEDISKNEPVIPPSTNVAVTLQNEKDNQPTTSAEQSPAKPCDAATNQQVNAETESSPSKELNAAVNLGSTACPGQISEAPEAETDCTSVPSTSQTLMDDSTIVTLNFITEDLPEDTELSNAVKSINGDFATIILSPLVKSQDFNNTIATQENCIIDLTDSPLVGEQAQLVTQSSDGSISFNTLSGDCGIYSVSGTSNSTVENSVPQLMPVPSSTFPPTGNIYINSRMANSGPVMPPNIVLLSNSCASSQKQSNLFQTPPRPGSVYSVGQTMSPKFSQGSTIYLASPVQPVLQGVMGMFPLSLVGQSGSTFTAPSHQILHVPVSKAIVPKLPLPPRSQKPAPLKPSVTAGKSNLSNSAAETSSASSSSVAQRLGNEGKRFQSESTNIPDDKTLPDSTIVFSKEAEAHRRVLCFDGATAKLASPSSTISKSKKTDKNETIKKAGSSSGSVTLSRSNVPKESKKTGKSDSVQKVGSSSGSVASSRSNVSKENKKTESSVLKNQKASTTSAITKDQAAEKRPVAPSDGTIGNKENVLQVKTGKQGAAQVDKRSNTKESEKNVKRPQETSKKPTSLPNILRRTPQKVPSERVCPTSPLVKQASHLLQGMQFQSPTSKTLSQGDLTSPPTLGSGVEDKPLDVDQTRTPRSKRYNENGGTPKPMCPPATPDMPTCSPASETGSETSVNMAAHTLMILSRASLAKPSGNTPLKDNTQQLKSSKSASKKRKLEETEEYERPSHKKDHLSPSALQDKKKTKKNRKKSMDSFPAGMDVDKFLMSLHYDE